MWNGTCPLRGVLVSLGDFNKICSCKTLHHITDNGGTSAFFDDAIVASSLMLVEENSLFELEVSSQTDTSESPQWSCESIR